MPGHLGGNEGLEEVRHGLGARRAAAHDGDVLAQGVGQQLAIGHPEDQSHVELPGEGQGIDLVVAGKFEAGGQRETIAPEELVFGPLGVADVEEVAPELRLPEQGAHAGRTVRGPVGLAVVVEGLQGGHLVEVESELGGGGEDGGMPHLGRGRLDDEGEIGGVESGGTAGPAGQVLPPPDLALDRLGEGADIAGIEDEPRLVRGGPDREGRPQGSRVRQSAGEDIPNQGVDADHEAGLPGSGVLAAAPLVALAAQLEGARNGVSKL